MACSYSDPRAYGGIAPRRRALVLLRAGGFGGPAIAAREAVERQRRRRLVLHNGDRLTAGRAYDAGDLFWGSSFADGIRGCVRVARSPPALEELRAVLLRKEMRVLSVAGTDDFAEGQAPRPPTPLARDRAGAHAPRGGRGGRPCGPSTARGQAAEVLAAGQGPGPTARFMVTGYGHRFKFSERWPDLRRTDSRSLRRGFSAVPGQDVAMSPAPLLPK